jgi:predicted nucleic acid-binding protein
VSFVIDASVAISWFFEDEQTPQILNLLREVSRDGCVVPSLWRLEIANVLQMGIKRKRIDGGFRDAAIRRLSNLPIEIDPETDAHAWTTTLRLADVHRITTYDACYLELAVRRKLSLATRDAELAVAAGNAGVMLLPTG